jgi:hypothetical protein
MYARQFATTQDVFKNKSIKSITKNKSIEIQEASNSANDLSPMKTETDEKAKTGKPASPKKVGSPNRNKKSPKGRGGRSPRPAQA